MPRRALGIALTKRGKHKGADIPMCGVPVERANDYLQRLIAQGFRVAVCEQLEDPAEARKRGSKSVVKRDVIRLVTPGTITEEQLLDSRRNNWLLAVARGRPSSGEALRFGLAWADISTGAFHVAEVGGGRLAAEIARLDPGEIVLSDALYSDAELNAFWREQRAVTPLGRDLFDAATAERRLSAYFGIATAGRLRGVLAPRTRPRPPPSPAMSSAPRSASARRWRRRSGKRWPRPWRSTPRPASISNCCARCPAPARAA